MLRVAVDRHDDREADRGGRESGPGAWCQRERLLGAERLAAAEPIVQPVLEPSGEEPGDEPTNAERPGLLDLPELGLDALEASLGLGGTLSQASVLAS
jgi:hypothetical protein